MKRGWATAELRRNSAEVASWPRYIRGRDLETFDDASLMGSVRILERGIEERRAILRERGVIE